MLAKLTLFILVTSAACAGPLTALAETAAEPTVSPVIQRELERRRQATDDMINEIFTANYGVRLLLTRAGGFVVYPVFDAVPQPQVFERARARLVTITEELRDLPSRTPRDTQLLVAAAKQFDAAEAAFSALSARPTPETFAGTFAQAMGLNVESPLVYELFAAALVKMIETGLEPTAGPMNFGAYENDLSRVGPFGQKLLLRLGALNLLSRAQIMNGAFVEATPIGFEISKHAEPPATTVLRVRDHAHEAWVQTDGTVQLYDFAAAKILSARLRLPSGDGAERPLVRFEGRSLVIENPVTGEARAYHRETGRLWREFTSMDGVRRRLQRESARAPGTRTCRDVF